MFFCGQCLTFGLNKANLDRLTEVKVKKEKKKSTFIYVDVQIYANKWINSKK